jgi:hypothetical protein
MSSKRHGGRRRVDGAGPMIGPLWQGCAGSSVTALTLIVAGAEAGGLLPLAKRQGLLVKCNDYAGYIHARDDGA